MVATSEVDKQVDRVISPSQSANRPKSERPHSLEEIEARTVNVASNIDALASILANNPSKEDVRYCADMLRKISQALAELAFPKNFR